MIVFFIFYFWVYDCDLTDFVIVSLCLDRWLLAFFFNANMSCEMRMRRVSSCEIKVRLHKKSQRVGNK